MSEREPVKLEVDEAMKRLVVVPEYDAGSGPEPCVHSLRIGSGMMLGAHWSVEKAKATMKEHGVAEVEGLMGHTLLVVDDTGSILFEAVTPKPNHGEKR